MHPDDPAVTEPVNWDDWRMCPICRAPIGGACFTLSGRVIGGRPDGVRTELPRPHTLRRRRIRRKAR